MPAVGGVLASTLRRGRVAARATRLPLCYTVPHGRGAGRAVRRTPVPVDQNIWRTPARPRAAHMARAPRQPRGQGRGRVGGRLRLLPVVEVVPQPLPQSPCGVDGGGVRRSPLVFKREGLLFGYHPHYALLVLESTQ